MVTGMSDLENQSAIFESKIAQISLYFSLLAGNSGRERLAPDCALRHTVCNAEKSAWIPLKNARRNFAILALKPDWGKCPPQCRGGGFAAFSPEAT